MNIDHHINDATTGPEQTRQALVQAALKLFGKQGFDGTSTREIAAEAKANVASIGYHFGGKDGLRLAAADHIVQTLQALAAQRADAPAPATREQAAEQLEATLRRMLSFLVAQPAAGEIVQFVLRELSSPTAALDRIYSGVFEPIHKRLCVIWEAATGEQADSDTAKLAVFTMIGQVIYFRIGREAVLRRMGWTDIGPEETAKIVDIAVSNLRAAIGAHQKKAEAS